MAEFYDKIPADIGSWLSEQKMFFVATAPLSGDGHINCSPRGLDSFRVLTPDACAFLDLTGSGVETIAHLRENGRIVLMFCAFDGAPRIVRLYGSGRAHPEGSEEFEKLSPLFPALSGRRTIIKVEIDRVGTSCGFAVPLMDFVSERDQLTRWADAKGPEGVRQYRNESNRQSLDGLPGLDPD